jgi:hypothetical protein
MATAAMTVASWWSVRLAYADHLYSEATLSSVCRAVELAPDKAPYHSRLAELLYDKDRERSTAELSIALRLNPRDAKTWIELGLREEFRNDYAEAERCFLEAARVDKRFLPRWTLAGFCFRRNKVGPFWRWAGEAAAMSFGDPAPLFRLCLLMTPDAPGIVRSLDLTKPRMIAGFLGFLLSENRNEDLAPVGERLAAFDRPEDGAILLSTCDRLLATNRFEEGLKIWNRMCERKLLPYPPIAAGSNPALTNPDWGAPPLSRGFDWRVAQLEGVSLSRQEKPPALRVDFSGRQPESCEVVSQLIPVLGSTSYEIRSRYRTSGIGPKPGVAWKAVDSESGQNLAESVESLSREEDSTAAIRFHTLRGSRAVRLSLAYQRAIGTTRIEGTIWLGKMELVRRN